MVPSHDDSAFTLEANRRGQVAVLTLRGPLTGRASDILQRGLVFALASFMPPHLVVEAVEVTAVDQEGRAMLLAGHRHALESGGRMLVIAGPRLPGDLDLRTSVEAAVAELQALA